MGVKSVRDWSVYPVWIVGEPAGTYLQVRADEGALGVGQRVSIRPDAAAPWRMARVVEGPASAGDGFRLWLALEPEP